MDFKFKHEELFFGKCDDCVKKTNCCESNLIIEAQGKNHGGKSYKTKILKCSGYIQEERKGVIK